MCVRASEYGVARVCNLRRDRTNKKHSFGVRSDESTGRKAWRALFVGCLFELMFELLSEFGRFHETSVALSLPWINHRVLRSLEANVIRRISRGSSSVSTRAKRTVACVESTAISIYNRSGGTCDERWQERSGYEGNRQRAIEKSG